MDKEHPHTLAKLAALQARCDRLERVLLTMLYWSKDMRPKKIADIEELIKIINDD